MPDACPLAAPARPLRCGWADGRGDGEVVSRCVRFCLTPYYDDENTYPFAPLLKERGSRAFVYMDIIGVRRISMDL